MSDISLDVPEAIYISIRKAKLKKFRRAKFMQDTFTILGYPGEFSFLVAANQTEPHLTGCMGEQQNFAGIISPLQGHHFVARKQIYIYISTSLIFYLIFLFFLEQ